MSSAELYILFGGIGLFLVGMTMMSAGLRNACGEKLQSILEGATQSKVRAVLVGIATTVLVQSSSATDVMVIGFVNSGFMTISQAIGVIMGANIGTTITAQITAFNLGTYAPMILFVGAVLHLFVKKPIVKHVGTFILGFGMLFEGITLMKSAIAPLSQTEQFISFISKLSNPFAMVLFGIAFTALLQSSSSATVIFQAFAVQGILSYHTCVYLVIGSAIGSVTPNILASLTTNRDGKRTALLNLLFNLIRAVILSIMIGIVPQILTAIQSLSPDNVARQIANTHTIFAITAVILILPFTDYIVKLTYKILPKHSDEIRLLEERKLHYIANIESIPPSLAIKEGRKELSRMAQLAIDNLQEAVDYFFHKKGTSFESVSQTEDLIDYLEKEINQKLVLMHAGDMSATESNMVKDLSLAASDIERISDYAQNIAEYGKKLRGGDAKLTKAAKKELMELVELSMESVKLCVGIFTEEQYEKLSEAEEIEERVDQMKEAVIDSHIKRLMASKCEPLAGVLFTDMASDLERCSDHAINIAYALYQEPAPYTNEGAVASDGAE